MPTRAADLPQTPSQEAATVLVEQAATFARELSTLPDAAWGLPTDCPAWDVREVAAHVAGALEDGARLRVGVRHLLQARRRPAGKPQVDAVNDAQVADRAGRSGPEIAAEIERLAPRAARARRRVPRVIRSRRTGSADLPTGATVGYLFDVIYVRDLWMHRVDVARATGRAMLATSSDREVVAQVVRDLDRLGAPGPTWDLVLTGSTPGTWRIGEGEPAGTVSADAVDYLRLLSGRPGEIDLAVTGDPAVRDPALSARVIF